MRAATGILAFAATLCPTLAVYQGFNYGSTFTTGAAKLEADFEAEFKTAQSLIGAPGGGFTSARLYTMIQAGTAKDPISAIQAAIKTKTSLLLGLWASAGSAIIDNEIAALKTAISVYGTDFTSLVAGISVGSEDLYRVTPTGIQNHENPGAQPLEIAGYIKKVRDAIAGTTLASAPIGHVDTWTAWVNSSNQAVIDAADWIGVDAYPYFQETMPNDIVNNKNLFFDAVNAVKAAVGGKPVWITETGFPVAGKTVGQAVPSLKNAKTYWDEVGCALFGKTNTWWYTMQDAAPDTPNPTFGIIGNQLTETPLFDLSCSNVDTSSSSTSSASSPTSTAGSGSGSSSIGFSSTTVDVPTSLAGGSPGAGSGLPSSQSSLEATPTGTGSSSQPTGTSGSGGAGGGSNGTASFSATGTPSPTTSTVPGSGAAALSSSITAGFLAVMGAIFLL